MQNVLTFRGGCGSLYVDVEAKWALGVGCEVIKRSRQDGK